MDLHSIEDFRKKFGKRADKAIEVLGKLDKELVVIFETDIGRAILEDDIKRFEELLYNAAINELTVDDRAEFKYLLRRLAIIREKVDQYAKRLAQIEGE